MPHDPNKAVATLAWTVETEGHVWAIRPEMLASLRSQRDNAASLEAASQLLSEDLDLAAIAAGQSKMVITSELPPRRPSAKSGTPPNLRDSDGDDDGDGIDDKCGTCQYFDEDEGECTLYDYDVEPGQVCDDYEVDEDAQEEDQNDPEPIPASKSSRSASTRGRGRPPAINGAVATIPLKGVLMPQVSLLSLIFGIGGGLQGFRSQLKQAAADDSIGAIVLDIDSPGGLVDLIPETAQMVRDARQAKPVVAVVNTLAASAAYWIAAQAEEIVITPSGEAGSIGVYGEHTDISKALDRQGITPTLISAGKFKTEGNPYEPLSDDARAAMQDSVNDYYAMFTKDVAAGRGASVNDVRSGYGEGRVLPAKRAVSAGLADRIDTLEGVVTGLLKRSRGNSASSRGLLHGATYTPEERVRVFNLLEAGVTAGKDVV